MNNASRLTMITRAIFVCCISLPVFVAFSSSPGFAFKLEERVHKTVLDNGIRLLVLERPISPTVSLYIRHGSGAAHDESGYTGTAHLLEHMMFKGTTTIGTTDYEAESGLRRLIEEKRELLKNAISREGPDSKAAQFLEQEIRNLEDEKRLHIVTNEIDRLYRERGGVGLNASTGHDMTTYMVNLPSNSLELWARIESDRLMNPVFREFLQERNVVLEERKQMVDSRPERELMELFLASAFKAHHYRQPILGWASDIPRIEKEHVERFFRTHYIPSNMVITVVGDVSFGNVVSLVNSYF
ncbi:MAG: pitrilysin family protein, partial [Syntrophales bacterium]|nr:pitrilysin family protein [Syntrophales bacterium]